MSRHRRLQQRIRTSPWRQARQERNRAGRYIRQQIRASLAHLPGPADPLPPWAQSAYAGVMEDISASLESRAVR